LKQCRFLKCITGEDCPLIDTGLSFFRYLVPTEEIDKDPEVQPLFKDQDDEICFFHNLRVQSSIVTYLCQSRKIRATYLRQERRLQSRERQASSSQHATSSALANLTKGEDRSARVSQSALFSMTKSFAPSVQAMVWCVLLLMIFV
jgi:hypothetical protein